MSSLENTSALVTGGASGMGEATARRLAAEGAHVVIVDRDAAKGEVVAKDLDGAFAQADVTNEEEVAAAVAVATETAPLRACIHCDSFDPGARFECRQTIPARVSPKDAANACTLFAPRLQVERETGSTAPTSARKAFDDLFKF